MPNGNALRSIFNGTLEASMLFNEKSGLDQDLHTAIIDSSVKLLELVSEVLKPCPTPGRQHYLFNMKTIITILQVYFLNIKIKIIYFKFLLEFAHFKRYPAK